LAELRKELNSDLELEKKEAVKKVIASMTIGKDVSGLFAEVLKCVQTTDLELKKLVYLYLMNYAQSQPELVVLAINTFCRDTEDRNPLIRALSLRTMGCVRVQKVMDYLCEPLKRSLRDESAYVRKAAVLCAAKLANMSPELAEEYGLAERLREILCTDNNASVVANAIMALTDMQLGSESDLVMMDQRMAGRLLTILGECNEWGQIAILELLAERYRPTEDEDDFGERDGALLVAIEQISPWLQHVNPAVVMAAAKAIALFVERLTEEAEERGRKYIARLRPPLLSILNSSDSLCSGEVQYVALRNIRLFLQWHPELFSSPTDVKAFFCRLNESTAVKQEKLAIMVQLTSMQNWAMVLAELGEYMHEVETAFSRRAIIAIGEIISKLITQNEEFADVEKGLELLRSLLRESEDLDPRAQYVALALQKIVQADGKLLAKVTFMIQKLAEHVSSFEAEDARVSLIWLLGQTSIPYELNSIVQEPVTVQSQLLHKAFLHFLKTCLKDKEDRGALERSIKIMLESESKDMRERAVIYGRFLDYYLSNRKQPSLADELISSHARGVTDSKDIEKDLLSGLKPLLGTVASVDYRIPSEQRKIEEADLLNLDEDDEASPLTTTTPLSPALQPNSLLDLLS